jgi:hypothetical protein
LIVGAGNLKMALISRGPAPGKGSKRQPGDMALLQAEGGTSNEEMLDPDNWSEMLTVSYQTVEEITGSKLYVCGVDLIAHIP